MGNTWGLDSSQFSAVNPHWNRFLDHVVEDLAKNLGMTGVRAEMYPGWLNNELVPKLREDSDRELLTRSIAMLLHMSRSIYPGAARVHVGEVATMLLDSTMFKTHLRVVEFASQMNDMSPDVIEARRFIDFINLCLEFNRLEIVSRLLWLSLERDQDTIDRDTDIDGAPSLAETFSNELVIVLRKYNEPLPALEAARQLIEAITRDHLHADIPLYPIRPRGLTHKPRGCGECRSCEELDNFLQSPTETMKHFAKGQRIRQHLEIRLPPNLFKVTVHQQPASVNNRFNKGSEKVPRMTVTKLNREYQSEMDTYRRKLIDLENRMQILRSQDMKWLLEDNLYSELIMLDQIPYSREAQALETTASGSRKRAAEDEMVGPEGTRPRI